jgi:hypothetical protein
MHKGEIGETNGTTMPHNEYSDFLQSMYARHISKSRDKEMKHRSTVATSKRQIKIEYLFDIFFFL